ncbi:transcriptional regulator, LacI family [Noviherbaspirillum humi]|uniref:Transcriptional regulator, LacI family n=1 Tax=Noviherbaspirillum humi TaxID=1688639 RepID=A0A239JZ79_9BURK|nr:LacI family DNA-binding transcriptional regulator [Noviherbaspirillum humi]SNT11327.1 transcriptional regulator, LacI family [Noviherbaspirillum humi]
MTDTLAPRRRPTIRDVAQHADVNASTVSRALNPDTRHLLGEEVVKRVLESARHLGYRPNKAAAALRGGRSHLIGMLLPDITNPVFPPIVRGLEEELRGHGFSVMVASSGGNSAEQDQLLERMMGSMVDGLVIATASRQDYLVQRCLQENMPAVLVNRGEDARHVPEVVNDDFLSMKLAVDHLLALGHACIAHLSGPARLATGAGRSLGFRLAMEAADAEGIELACAEFTREAGALACAALLDRHAGITAIVAANDLIALGCYDTLKARGLRCPQDISIIGHNDMPLVDMLDPPLTTLRIQHLEMGRQAARLLLNHLQNPGTTPVRITLAPQLMARGSTAPPARRHNPATG